MSVRPHRLLRIPARQAPKVFREGPEIGRSSPRRGAGWVVGLVILAVTGCSGGESAVDSTVPTTSASTTLASTTSTTVPPLPMFGDMPSPCGPATEAGVPTIAEGQNSAESLRLGVANDNGFAGAPGSGSDMVDTARAFAEWCNAQGGIRGLPIEIVDLDAQGTGVPLLMERTCAEVFALVGGGWTFDDQMFGRFHECGLVSFPAFTVSAAATKSNGRAQALPTPIDSEATIWLDWIESTHSDAVQNVAIVHPDLPSTNALAERSAALMEIVGGFGEPTLVAYDPSDSVGWPDIVQQLSAENVRAVSFFGTSLHLVDFYAAMDAASYSPDVIFAESSLMRDELLQGVRSESLANLRIRATHGPFTEVDEDSAMASFMEMTTFSDPSASPGGLGVLTASSMLLFATAANSCLETDGNVLERECTLARALAITSWTAGGLHGPTDPSTNAPTTCIVVIGVTDGTWSRVFPQLGSPDDDGSGRTCDDDSLVDIEGDFGDVSAGIDSTRLN